MSQLEFTDDFEALAPADTGSTLLTTLLIGAGLFIIVGITFLLLVLGHRFGIGPFPVEPSNGAIAAVAANGRYVTFTGPTRERVHIGDIFYVYRNNDYVGRVQVERHPDATIGEAELQELATKTWKIEVGSAHYVGRVLLDYTISDANGRPDVRADDKVSSVRPSNLVEASATASK